MFQTSAFLKTHLFPLTLLFLKSPVNFRISKKMNFIRKMLPVLLPNLVVQTVWIVVMSQHNLWEKFRDNYFISIMMVFGSFVAGATSEGILLDDFSSTFCSFRISCPQKLHVTE